MKLKLKLSWLCLKVALWAKPKHHRVFRAIFNTFMDWSLELDDEEVYWGPEESDG